MGSRSFIVTRAAIVTLRSLLFDRFSIRRLRSMLNTHGKAMRDGAAAPPPEFFVRRTLQRLLFVLT